MEKSLIKDDRIWEQVLEALSSNGRLSKLYKLPSHEVTAMLKAYGNSASRDLAVVFNFIQRKEADALLKFVAKVGDYRVYAMLHTLIRCMRCWVETEPNVQSVNRRWRIANA